MNTNQHDANFLRLSLRGNAAFSFTSGLVLSVAHQPVANFIGVDQATVVLVIGLSLIVFALGLLISSNRETPSPLEARIAVILDLIWVAATPVIISLGLLSSGGNWVTVIIADIVLAFAILQYIGLRRLGNTARTPDGEFAHR